MIFRLVRRGGSGGECRGNYNSTTKTGSGLGYTTPCIHNGTIQTSGDLPTTWYNYALASAGTIVFAGTDTSDEAKVAATESVCPKGWALPDIAQINSQRDIATFSPVPGGDYGGGTLNKTERGGWWGSDIFNNNGAARRYRLSYDTTLITTDGARYGGFYIRCVQKST